MPFRIVVWFYWEAILFWKDDDRPEYLFFLFVGWEATKYVVVAPLKFVKWAWDLVVTVFDFLAYYLWGQYQTEEIDQDEYDDFD